MASNFKIATTLAASMLAALSVANSGKLRIYTTPQPANPQTAIGAVTLLAELTMNATAFDVADNVATARAVTKDSAADDTGTAAWFRLWASNGTTPICDGSVGTSNCDLNLATTSLVANVEVSITSFTITLPVA